MTVSVRSQASPGFHSEAGQGPPPRPHSGTPDVWGSLWTAEDHGAQTPAGWPTFSEILPVAPLPHPRAPEAAVCPPRGTLCHFCHFPRARVSMFFCYGDNTTLEEPMVSWTKRCPRQRRRKQTRPRHVSPRLRLEDAAPWPAHSCLGRDGTRVQGTTRKADLGKSQERTLPSSLPSAEGVYIPPTARPVHHPGQCYLSSPQGTDSDGGPLTKSPSPPARGQQPSTVSLPSIYI